MASQSATSSSRRKKLKGKKGYPERPASTVLSCSAASPQSPTHVLIHKRRFLLAQLSIDAHLR